jgi:ketosteroid isomerase-like protein
MTVNADLHHLVTTWADAERRGDRATLESLLTDDFLGIGPVGFVLPRDVWVTRFEHGLNYTDLDVDELTARTFGDAAVIVGRQRAHGEAQGNPTPDDTRVSIVASRIDAAAPWKIAHVQYSFIVAAPGGTDGQ